MCSLGERKPGTRRSPRCQEKSSNAKTERNGQGSERPGKYVRKRIIKLVLSGPENALVQIWRTSLLRAFFAFFFCCFLVYFRAQLLIRWTRIASQDWFRFVRVASPLLGGFAKRPLRGALFRAVFPPRLDWVELCVFIFVRDVWEGKFVLRIRFFYRYSFSNSFFTSDIQSTTPLRLRIRKSFIFPKVE